MEIRRYKRGEEAGIWKVYFAATHESNARDYHADLIERWAPHDQDMSQWADRLVQKNPFVAVVDEEILGMAEIEPDGFIDYFYVHPEWQGTGIGKALLATLESEAAKLGVNVISADVSVTAKAFFLSRGFCVMEAKSNVILGRPAPNFRMQKKLSSEPDGAANRSQPQTNQDRSRQRGMKWIVEGFDVVLLKKIGAVLTREGIHWEIAREPSNTRPCKAIFVPNEEFHRAVQIVQQLPDDFPNRPLDI